MDSGLYRPSGSLGSSYPPGGIGPMIPPNNSPFASPSHLSGLPNKSNQVRLLPKAYKKFC